MKNSISASKSTRYQKIETKRNTKENSGEKLTTSTIKRRLNKRKEGKMLHEQEMTEVILKECGETFPPEHCFKGIDTGETNLCAKVVVDFTKSKLINN